MGCGASKYRKEQKGIETERTAAWDDSVESISETMLREWLALARESLETNTAQMRIETPNFGFGTPAFGLPEECSFIPP